MRYQLRGASLCLTLAVMAGSSAHAADALNGKSLYLNGPVGGGASCTTCHGASPAANVSGILRAANNPTVISAAFTANKGGMGALFNGKFTTAEIADLAAFIGNPTVTAAPAASLTPGSLVFNGTTIGQSSAALSATLANAGTAALSIDTIGFSGAAAGDFSVNGGTCAGGASVAAGASCTVQLIFKPTVAGARAAALTISHNATGGTSSASLSGTGNAAPQATIGVSATSVNFGALITNTASAAQVITVSNSGSAALSFTSIALGGAQAGFVTLGGTCATATPLAAGASCTVTALARPTATGAFAASITLASNAANGNVTIGLAGSGAAPGPAVSANPSVLAFGTATVGAAALTQNVTLTNSGNVALSFTSIAVSGAAGVSIPAGGTCTGALAPAATCSVPLAFAPGAAGAVTATLLVRSNAPDLQVAVSGTGTTAPVAKPTLSDNGPLAFADTQVGKASAVRSTILQYPGTVALKIATLTLGGTHSADFALGGTCSLNGTVSPSASCTIDATFKPAAAGARSADLLLVTDGGAQFSVPLSGNGIAIAAPAVLTVGPQSFDFGAAVIGATSPNKRFMLSNTSTAAATLTGATFSGPFARVLDATGCAAFPFVLQPGAACELVVGYTPATAGPNSGNVVIQSEGGASWTIALAGQASAAPAPAPAAPMQNKGGGGCSSLQGGNDPMLPLLVVLALLVLVRRRSKS